MDQRITLKVAGKFYELKASTPEMERLMRLAANDVNSLLADFDSRFPDRSLEDKLVFVAIQEAVRKFASQKKFSNLSDEVTSLQSDIESYLKGVNG